MCVYPELDKMDEVKKAGIDISNIEELKAFGINLEKLQRDRARAAMYNKHKPPEGPRGNEGVCFIENDNMSILKEKIWR